MARGQDVKTDAQKARVPLSRTLRERIDALETLPVAPEVVFGIIQLGSNPDAGVADYARLLRADASLSSKLLALTNSSLFGVRRHVTTVDRAINLLGITNIRALAAAYCLTGVHNAWKLDRADARAYWEASLYKGAAAKAVARLMAPERAEEAFVCALFQDIAIGLHASLDDGTLGRMLRDPNCPICHQLTAEQSRFGQDHAESAALIARKLKLPSPYVDAIRAHHDHESLVTVLGDRHLALAAYIASLFPHDIRCWKPQDLQQVNDLLDQEGTDQFPRASGFISSVEAEFDELITLLGESTTDGPSITDLITEACAQNVRLTESLVGDIQALRARNASLSSTVGRLANDHSEASLLARLDPLTDLLNRRGFLDLASLLLSQARDSAGPVAVAMFDLDLFKGVNDSYGHDCGDMLLRAVANRLREAVRTSDSICRWGGDEIVMLICGASLADCINTVRRIQEQMAKHPLKWRDVSFCITMSAGLRWVEQIDDATPLEQLIKEADEALYLAKQSQRGSFILWQGPAVAQEQPCRRGRRREKPKTDAPDQLRSTA